MEAIQGEVVVARNGALRDPKTGRIVGVDPSRAVGEPSLIRSSADSRALNMRKRAIGLRAQLRGLIAGTGGKVPESAADDITDEELLAAGTALQALTTHLAATFTESKSLRGMAEVYDKLSAPLVGDRRTRDDGDDTGREVPRVVLLIAQYLSEHGATVIDASVNDN